MLQIGILQQPFQVPGKIPADSITKAGLGPGSDIAEKWLLKTGSTFPAIQSRAMFMLTGIVQKPTLWLYYSEICLLFTFF
jgi:hypothetical protein